MEEDNAADIFKSVIASTKDVLCAEFVAQYDGKQFRTKARAKGNLLCCEAVGDVVHEPLVFVLEKFHVKKEDETADGFPFSICFSQDCLTLVANSAELRDKWMLRVATCSHQMAKAELDATVHKVYTLCSSNTSTHSAHAANSLQNFFLANAFKKEHHFSISSMVRALRENLEVYEGSIEFLSNYSHGYFRPSIEKYRVAFAPAPTNLHVHYFSTPNATRRYVLTAGTSACLPLRFQHGGATRVLSSLEIGPSVAEPLFTLRRQALMNAKKSIGEMSRRMEGRSDSFKKTEKCYVELLGDVKQIREVSNAMEGADVLVDVLVETQNGRKNETDTREGLRAQWEEVDASLISLNTKVASLAESSEQGQLEFCIRCAHDAMASTLDKLLAICECLLDAQLLSLLATLQKSSSSVSLFLHLQMRCEFILSQATTVAATALLCGLEWSGATTRPFLSVFSFLSCYGDEKGMLEDAMWAWKALENLVSFRWVRGASSVTSSCVPSVTGNRANIVVSLPLPQPVYDSMEKEAVDKPFKVSFLFFSLNAVFHMRTAFWNLGVNHEATFASSLGGTALETAINTEALHRIQSYAESLGAGLSVEAHEALLELTKTVTAEPSRKNLAIFEWAQAVCDALGASTVLSCKSGKDRTSMAVTLEQGRYLRETCALNVHEVSEVVDELRKNGVRRECCRKNVGKPLFSFSPFQMRFLPKSFRPPDGTYSTNIST